ncbi:MAG TPA: hypothetical protein VGF67_13870 [Ktedonobacteraceae bacterium]
MDWENGLAIVQLGNVLFSSAWGTWRAQLVLKEINTYLLRWQNAGGVVHPSFPDPQAQADRFTIGEPKSISATFVETALRCLSCNRLVFLSKTQLAAAKRQSTSPFQCPGCGKTTLRQSPQIFVHGCGEFVSLRQWMPTLKNAGGKLSKAHISLLCRTCGNESIVEMPSRSERARDLKVRCRNCRIDTVERLNSRCHTCFTNPLPLPPGNEQDMNERGSREATIVTRVLMRATNYRASEAYYPHTMTFLRLDRPQYTGFLDEEAQQLRQLLPVTAADPSANPTVTALALLTSRLQAAQAQKNEKVVQQLIEQIASVSTSNVPASAPTTSAPLFSLSPELQRSVQESLAFKTTVHTVSSLDLLSQDQQRAAAGLLPERPRSVSGYVHSFWSTISRSLAQPLVSHVGPLSQPMTKMACFFPHRSALSMRLINMEPEALIGPAQLEPFPFWLERASMKVFSLVSTPSACLPGCSKITYACLQVS